MKTGRTLTELAAEIERQAATKKDYLADSRALELVVNEDNKPLLAMSNGHTQQFGLTEIAHEQVSDKTGIPQRYYDRMRQEAPALLVRNVNHWFTAQPGRHLVRTLDGNARALLSDRYRPLDNFDLAEIVLPRLMGAGCRVESAELTERRLYIKAITDRITSEVKKGDVVQAGLVITNSEVGLGAVKIEPMIFRLVCLNGAIAADSSLRKQHIGKAGDWAGLEGAAEFYRDETRAQDDKAFWMKVSDVVGAALTQISFDKIIQRFREATEQKIVGDPIKVVEVTAQKLGLNDTERGGVLRHLIEGGDLSAYGLLNAITRHSQDVESYDRATELERLGPRVLELPRQAWAELSEAA